MNHPSSPVVRSVSSVIPEAVARSRGAAIQVLIGPADGAPNFVTRRFTLAPGGRIPQHRHDTIEHEQLMIDGVMVLGLGEREVEVREGDAIFIPAGTAHWYENRSERPAVFVCVVPTTADYHTEWLEGPAG
jgi:quercetin dioxygenase-like cupin family protein